MEPMESCAPPGFRFHPTDEELVGYYLKKKVASQSIDRNVIKDINLYRIEPSDIQERCRIGYAEQNEWYFFSHKDKKYPTGTRTNRATMTGFWKATGRDKAIFRNTTLIGMRKTLVFYKGRAPNGQKSDWIMHEYRLQTHQNAPPQEEGWVVCRAFRKRSTNVNRKASNQACDSSSSNYNLHEETISGLSSSSAHHRPINLPNLVPSSSSHGFLCKQELDHNTATTMMMMMNNINNILYTDPQTQRFLQLPQLECPSPILPVLPYQNNNNSKNNRKDESDIIIEHIDHNSQRVSPVEKVTDWRALDKFVASQLSYDDNEQRDHRRPKHNDQGAVHSSFGGHDNNEHGLLDMALLLLQNNGKDGGGEGDKFINGILHI